MLEYINIISLLPLCFLIICIVQYLIKKSLVDPGRMAYGAASTGILLTFFGIWQGLIGFDVANTDSSIPQLLEGLKIAFSSSVFGLFSSIVINLIFIKSEKSQDVQLAEVVSSLSNKIGNFSTDLADANVSALGGSIDKMVSQLEMGINSETKESIEKFKESIEMLRDWQEKYI